MADGCCRSNNNPTVHTLTTDPMGRPPHRRFHLHRDTDVTGVSGPGRVVEGIQFSSGVTVLNWLTTPSSVSVWQSIEEAITVHGHDGATRVVWVD
jgi:hypothetical protein